MIEIISYQTRWPSEFLNVANKIRSAIRNSALAIHHIGSTSVPLLAAKDVIDVQITVNDLDIPISSALAQAGFESTDINRDHCPPGMELSAAELEKRYFRVKDRRVNLHVRKTGAFNQKYPVLFRDYLRSNPLARDSYGEIKKQLARYFPENVEAYYDVKDPVCDLIIFNALEWAKVCHWLVPPTDV
jgi:GrpB-like predicted nucleotidyltransferase (UPF0157 family)